MRVHFLDSELANFFLHLVKLIPINYFSLSNLP